MWEKESDYTYNYDGKNVEATMQVLTVDMSGNDVPAHMVSESEKKSIAQSDDRDWSVVVTVYPEHGEAYEDLVVPSADTLEEAEERMETISEDNTTDDEVIELARA